MIVFGASAVGALVWAIRSGQMSNPTAAAASIFDRDEPIGRVTDHFPWKVRCALLFFPFDKPSPNF